MNETTLERPLRHRLETVAADLAGPDLPDPGSVERQVARYLMSRLALSYDQLGQALGVSGETVRRWDQGNHPIPGELLAKLSEASAALDRLEAMFQAERLSQVVRRKASSFEGESALDWILRGKIGAAVDRYEPALAYQA
jgi:transcriptional regulator with XRE-family HTH domain